MQSPLRRSWPLLLVLLLVAAVFWTPAFAISDGGRPSPLSGSGPELSLRVSGAKGPASKTIRPGIAPTGTISPEAGSVRDSLLAVTITWCADDSSGSVRWNEVDVTSQFTKAGAYSTYWCDAPFTLKGTVKLKAGHNTISSSARDSNWNTGYIGATYVLDRAAPTIVVSPAAGTVPSSNTQVKITWKDDVGLAEATRKIWYDGQDVTGRFSYSATEPDTLATSTWYPSFTVGTHTLAAVVCDEASRCSDTARISYTYTGNRVDVTPDGAAATVEANKAAYHSFTVKHTGEATTTFSLSATCGYLSQCEISPYSVTLVPGDSTVAKVHYWPQQPGDLGVVKVKAAGTSAYSGTPMVDSGTIRVTVAPSALVKVTPDGAISTVAPYTSNVQPFTVTNPSTSTQTYTIAGGCSGMAVRNCTVSESTVTLAPGASRQVTISYTSTSVGTVGDLFVRASVSTNTAQTDGGTVEVRVADPPLSVTPDNGSDAPQESSSATTYFTITNRGTASEDLRFAATCAGAAVAGGTCTVYPSAAVVGPGLKTDVSVLYKAGPAGSTGRIDLSATNTATGQERDRGFVMLSVASAPTITVSVTPDGEAVQALAGTGQTRAFTVTSSATTTFNLTCAASGTGVTGCSLPGGSSVSLSAGVAQTVNVSYTVGAVGTTGTLTLTATQSGGSATDKGFISVSASSTSGTKQLAPVVKLAPHVRDGANTERDLCVDIAVGAAGASQCGDLRLVHALPAMRTVNKTRVPMLIYNSSHAAPRILVAADVTLPADGMQPTRVVAQLIAPDGKPAVTREWPGTHWQSGSTRRILLDLDASTKPTNLYAYTLKVENWYGTLQKNLYHTAPVEVAVVNRGQLGSRFGAGWWLAGYEQLVFPVWDRSVILWVGGDGSTRKYVKDPTRDVWRAATIDRPDSITRSATDYKFTRYLRGGGKVGFGVAGEHAHTEDRLGTRTLFIHDSGLLLRGIRLPGATSYGPEYSFSYDGNGTLSSVSAPGQTWSTPRRVALLVDASGRLQSITDPDSRAVSFGYSGSERRVSSRTDKRGTTTTFGYDAAGKVSSSLVFADGQRIELRVASAESEGLSSASVLKDPSAVMTQIDGPRPDSDVRDVTTFWIGRFGAVERVRDGIGNETVLVRGDARFPGLVTEVLYPRLEDGRQKVTRSTYTALGLPWRVTEVNPYGTGDAVTAYEYDGIWPEFVRKITRPEGDSVRMGYDGRGNRVWQEDGRGAMSRVSFTHLANGLVSTITAPGPAGSGAAKATTTLGYDTQRLGNLQTVSSPLQSASWVVTRYVSDAIGRDTLVVQPVEGSDVRKQFTRYDVMDRVLETRSVGWAWNGLAMGGGTRIMDTVTVTNEYDPEGNTRFVTRKMNPDPNVQGSLRTEWIYDTIGRVKQINHPDRSSELIAYNEAGHTTRNTTRRVCNPSTGARCTITTRYDALGRMVERIVPQLTYPTQPTHYIGDTKLAAFPLYPLDPDHATQRLVIPADVQTFGYDALGNLRFAKNRDAWVRRGYHIGGAVRADTLNIRTYTGTDFSRHQYVQTYGYDKNGRRTRASHPVQLAPVPGGQVTYGYHPGTGDLNAMQDAMGNRFSWTHDAQGNVETYAPQVGFTERFTYDLDGRLARRSGTTSKYGGANHLPSSTYRDDRFTYDLLGRARTRSGSMGETGNYQYAGNGALAYSDEVTSELSYLYRHIDALGNPVTEKEWVPGTPGTDSEHGYMAQRNYRYEYGRVVSQDNRPDGSATYDFDFAAEYDQAGNRDVVASGRVVNPDPNDPQAIYERSRSYYGADERLRVVDRRKCLTKKVWSSSLGRYTTVCVAWDQRLDPEPSVFEEYRYDALGRRILVRSRPDTQCSNCPAFIQRTVWDGDQILHEIRYPGADGADLEKDAGWGPSGAYGRITYTHGPGIDAPLSLAREYFSLAGSAEGKFAAILHGNWRGLADIATFPDGTVRRCDSGGTNCTDLRSAFDWPATNFNLFYRRRVVSQTTPPNWIGSLVSNKRDASGQLYMRNRYYDPTTGQFTQEDPIGLAGGLNLYGYANGDPVNYSDPFGLSACPIVCDVADVGFFIGSAVKFARDRSRENAINLGLDAVGLLPIIPSVGMIRRLDDLADAAKALDKGGELTKAGRALEKHGSRGGAFPQATGNAAAKNAAGQQIVEDIINSPGARRVDLERGRFKGGFDIYAPDGRGVRYDKNGGFAGFLEPPR